MRGDCGRGCVGEGEDLDVLVEDHSSFPSFPLISVPQSRVQQSYPSLAH